jgi:hypothetical protein
MKLAVLLLALSVSACTSFLPSKPKFPEPTVGLNEPCPDLKKIEGNPVAITDLLRTVAENYTMYYECSAKNTGWNEWYIKQRDIYNRVK